MKKLDSLKLPNTFPHKDSINAMGQNIHDYESEFWELQYEVHRYLKNINDENLISRYKSLHRNFQAFTDSERHVIPINSFLSSWYWYRKEHQTRYEFLLRGLPLPLSTPQLRKPFNKAFSPKSPNACDILFKYGELKYMKQMVDEGKIRISPASKYKDGSAFDPRTDDELNKNRWEQGDRIKVRTQNGKEIPIIGDLKRTVSASNDYYTLCLSCDFEPMIFKEFNYDSCVIIKNPVEFAFKLERELNKVLPKWYFHHNPTEYFDPHEHIKNHYFSATMSKDFSYAYQKEYRFLWDSMIAENAIDYIEISLGSLNDICELYTIRT